jgi:hypothetical protein
MQGLRHVASMHALCTLRLRHSYMYLALALAQLDDPDNAAAAFARAIAMEPAEPLLRLNHGAAGCGHGAAACAA